MSKRLKKIFVKYGITALVCLALAAVYCAFRDFFNLPRMEQYRALCDGFTIPGLLSLAAGVLVWVSEDGFFYGLGYALYVARKSLTPGGRLRMKKYYDYVQEHRQKKITGYSFLFVVGGVCMVVAITFLVLFYRLY